MRLLRQKGDILQITGRFTIALHILSCIETFKNEYRITSKFLAGSIGANPVIIRNILLQLKAAGIIKVSRGHGGMEIIKPLNEITFLDVYKAIEPLDNGSLFRFHENPNPKCPVGKNIHKILDSKLIQVQKAMENELSKMTLADLFKDLTQLIE